MPVIPVDRVVAKKRQIGKNGGLRGEEQGVDVDNRQKTIHWFKI
jgi:hypothetical protein